jgi:hypothetical protein
VDTYYVQSESVEVGNPKTEPFQREGRKAVRIESLQLLPLEQAVEYTDSLDRQMLAAQELH